MGGGISYFEVAFFQLKAILKHKLKFSYISIRLYNIIKLF
jgi:hypothetical protein